MSQITTIQLKKSTRSRLKKYGMKDNTYDLIVNNLMNFKDNHNEYERINPLGVKE